MSISDHRNGLASTIEFMCNRKKQDKRLNNHNFPLHLPQKTKHHSVDPRYEADKWYSINFQSVFGMQLIGQGGGSTKLLGMQNIYCQGLGNYLKKIEAYTGMAERMVQDLGH